jgi:RHS repeat-associated protein
VHGRLESQETEKTGSDIIKINHTYDKNNNTRIVRHKVNGITTDTIIRTYDGLNRVKAKSVSSIGIVSYTYDIIVNRTDIEQGLTAEMSQDPYGNITTKVYDKAGRLKNVIDGDASSGTLCATYEYNPNGSRRSLTYENGSKAEYTYWENGLLKKLVNMDSLETVIDEYNYEYDEAQNMENKTEIINNVNKGTTTYQYDELNRLKNVSEQDGARIINYTYDPAGNRETEIIQMGTTRIESEYEYDGQDLLLSIDTVEKVNGVVKETYQTSYQYDDNGNMTEIWKDSTLERKYEYDVLNRMTAVKNPDGSIIMESTYNGEGLRVSKTVGATTTEYLYEYRNVVLEISNGQETGRNIYGTNLVNRTVDQTDTLYYLYNGRGDVTSLIDTTGTVEGTYYYDSFGNILERTGNVDNSITYAGYQYDKETEIVENGEVVQTGLYYLNARMYDPNIARFLQQDTYTGDPNDPLSLNLYTYCNNEPIRHYDPTGHALTQWDVDNLPLEEQQQILELSERWTKAHEKWLETGNDTARGMYDRIKTNVRKSAKAIRDRYRNTQNQYVNKEGFTVTVSLTDGSIIDPDRLASEDDIQRVREYMKTKSTDDIGKSTEGTGNPDYSINGMANNMQRLADLATQYKQSSGVNISVNELVLQYIRRGARYSGGNWPSVAGQINAGFVTFVGNNSSDLAGYFNDSVVIKDPLTQNEVDFVHWAATLNGLIYDTGWSDAGYKSLIGEAHIDNLCGWAGDLQTLVRDVITQTNNSDDYSVLYARASKLMGTTDASLNSTFPMNDLLADTDAFNIYNKLGSSSLVNAFKTYYSGGNSTRYKDFTGNRDKEAIRSLAGTYTNDWLVWPVTKWPLLNGVDVSDNQSKAVRDAFTDFIWNKVQGEK